MKQLILPLLAILFLASCDTDSNEVASPSNSPIQYRAANKVYICHNGHVIHVSVNAIPAHEAHGDAIDYDGDGFFSGPNDCGMPVDCNEEDPNLNESCCPTGIWCGQVNYFFVEALFNEDCTADIIFNGANCELGEVFWTLQSVEGNVFSYLETDPCGITGCTVTLTAINDELTISYSCDPEIEADGTLVVCDPE